MALLIFSYLSHMVSRVVFVFYMHHVSWNFVSEN